MGANAQTSVPAFTSGQVLTAAQMTQVNTGIPVFASSTERDAAFGGAGEKTLAEGQMAYLEDTNETQVYDGSAWAAVAGGKILQVVSTTYSTAFSTTSTSYVGVTGLSVSITPSSATSKVLVILSASVYTSSTNAAFVTIYRDSVATGTNLGDSDDGFGRFLESTSQGFASASILDSPATTSATTYEMAVKTNSDTIEIMRSGSYNTITVMEVSA